MNVKTCVAIVVFVSSILASVIPTLAQQPWDTPQGRTCFEQWIRDAMGRINRYNGNPDHNARKPWFINQYGILNGNPRYGPTSTAAPDNFRQYQNKHRYMWDYWHVPNGYWRWSEWRAAGVPHIRNYVMNCLRGAGGTTGGTSGGGAAGASQTTVDVVRQNETFGGDRVGDWSFGFRLRGSGTVTSITIRNTNGQYSVWDTIPGNSSWLVAVYSGQRRLNRSDGSVMFNVNGVMDLTLYVADNGSLAAGRTRYKITVKFRDGRVAEFDPATTRTVLAPSPGGGQPSGAAGMEWNVDRPGSDFSNFNLPRADPGLCADACAKDRRCKAWTYIKPNTIQGPHPRCWLKHSVPRAVAQNCCVSGVKGGAGTSGTTQTGRRYDYPRARRYRLDWCHTWATNCGRGAADAFCRAKGHSRSSNWQMDPDIGGREPTYVIGDGNVCSQAWCDGFKWITCE